MDQPAPAGTGTALPYVVCSCAESVDGHIDDTSARRLVLSNEEDLDSVDALRAECDAILVGAGTMRSDDPRLLVRSASRRAQRRRRGLPESPARVTITTSGELDPTAAFFSTGDTDRIVYCASQGFDTARRRVGALAAVVDAGAELDAHRMLADLGDRGVRRLLVEGGTTVHTWLLRAGVVDELRLAVAPFFVGDPRAPSFVGAGPFPHHAGRRMRLAEVRQLGDVAVLRYLLQPGRPGAL